MSEKLQKIIAASGLCSRRAAEKLIENGEVRLNGAPAKLGDRAENADIIEVRGVPLAAPPEKITIEIYKPRGVVCTMSDELGRRCVGDILREMGYKNLYPVGRLDKDSEGKLICTNDGALALRYAHPRYGHNKIYYVYTASEPSSEQLDSLKAMRVLDGEKINPVQIEKKQNFTVWTLSEGKNRQIRRMCAAVGLKVTRLIRKEIEA